MYLIFCLPAPARRSGSARFTAGYHFFGDQSPQVYREVGGSDASPLVGWDGVYAISDGYASSQVTKLLPLSVVPARVSGVSDDLFSSDQLDHQTQCLRPAN